MSTTDLIHWEIEENVLSSKGNNNQVPYSEALLFAPDCMYYCVSDIKGTEGVATSKNPLGPFINGKKIELKGIEGIEPAVFMDDDGQAYYIWSQFEAKIAKLKPNMMEMDTATIIMDLLTEKEHFFHEGGFL